MYYGTNRHITNLFVHFLHQMKVKLYFLLQRRLAFFFQFLLTYIIDPMDVEENGSSEESVIRVKKKPNFLTTYFLKVTHL